MGHETGFVAGTTRGAVAGTLRGGTAGNRLPQAFRVVITNQQGRRMDVTKLADWSLDLRHTALSDLTATLPRRRGVQEFLLGWMTLYYGGQQFFRAKVRQTPGPGSQATATLAGHGVGRSLARGEISVSYTNTLAHNAIDDVWETHTTFAQTIFAPAAENEVTLDDYSKANATPLEVLQDLHERAGMRFSIQHQQADKVVESFVPEEVVQAVDWRPIDDDSEFEAEGYANFLIVEGGIRDDGTRPRATAKDQNEIDQYGTEPWPITRPELTTDAQCQEVADKELRKRTKKTSLSGELSIRPKLIQPGYYYRIPEWVVDGAAVELPVDSVSIEQPLDGSGEPSATMSINAPSDFVDEAAAMRRRLDEHARLF